MKKITAICLFAAAVAAAGLSVGCEKVRPGGGSGGGGRSSNFVDSELMYGWDDHDAGTGIYYIALSNGLGQGSSEGLYLEFSSDYFEDLLQASPALGTYTYGDTYEKFTFNGESDYWNEVTGEEYHVTGGSFSLVRDGVVYDITYDLVLDNGEAMRGSFDGIIMLPGGDKDVDVFEEMGEPTVVAYESPEHAGLWTIHFSSDGASENELRLVVNTATGLSRLPTGNFPMAAAARQGVVGTAEPSSIYQDDGYGDDVFGGCMYVREFRNEENGSGYGYFLYSVPGKGFVNIGRSGEDYTVEFSYEMAGGKTVSGNYTGYLYHVDDEDWRK